MQMNELPDSILNILVTPWMSGVSLGVVLLAIASQNRPFLRDVAQDSSRFWRVTARVSLSLLVASLIWVTLLDNWLQLSAEPYRLSRSWESQRVVFDPVATEIRIVSVALLLATAVGLAALFARHAGGYVAQMCILIVATVAWIPLFIFQQRLNLLVLDAVESSTSWGGFAGIVAFWTLRTAFGLLSIAASAFVVTFLIAPVVTLILDLLRLRIAGTTTEADPFFAALKDRSDGYDDASIKSHWRPIRRPL
jgi:hypothetical protein